MVDTEKKEENSESIRIARLENKMLQIEELLKTSGVSEQLRKSLEDQYVTLRKELKAIEARLPKEERSNLPLVPAAPAAGPGPEARKEKSFSEWCGEDD